MELSEELENKLKNLISFVKNKKVIVAFSGGVDSSLLAYIANEHASEALLITESSILYPEDEIEEAREFALENEIPHMIIKRDPLKDKEFTANPYNRCYTCKKGLYKHIIRMMSSRQFELILDGSNVDDLEDYRPGMQALKELNIATPYIQFQDTKQEIRELCRYFNLEVHSKPSMACFSSRIPYGQVIDEEKLHKIREGEKFLKQTFDLKQLRVRYHQNELARIEILQEDFPKVLSQENFELLKNKFKELGFCYITIDVEGFRSGSLNEILDL